MLTLLKLKVLLHHAEIRSDTRLQDSHRIWPLGVYSLTCDALCIRRDEGYADSLALPHKRVWGNETRVRVF